MSKKLTLKSLEFINQVSYYNSVTVSNKLEKALHLSMDAHRETRLKNQECKACFYTGSYLAGQAFTKWKCFLCEKEDMWPNTAIPKLCPECAKAYRLCVTCGGDLEMKRRTKFERKAK